MTREEARAVSFVGALLLLAAAARFAARPRPITITAGPIDIAALRAAGQAMQQPTRGKPGRKSRARPHATTTAEPPARDPPAPLYRVPLLIEEPPASGAANSPNEPLDLNRADTAALRRLPGVGPAMAKRIVARRDSIGRFNRLEDLDSVRGIGPALLKKLQPLVVVR